MMMPPILTTLIGIVLKYEAYRKLKLIGIAISFGGLIVLLIYECFSFGLATGLADLYYFMHSLCLATGIMIYKTILKSYHIKPIVIASFTFISGTIFSWIAYAT